MTDHPGKVLIIYDGICNLCDGLVKFVYARDREAKKFLFCALQSQAAAPYLSRFGISQEDALRSFVVVDFDKGEHYRQSTAALVIAANLPGIYPTLSSLGYCVPSFLRDGVYGCVAVNRYRMFGKKGDGEECLMPTKDVMSRFLDAEEMRAARKKTR